MTTTTNIKIIKQNNCCSLRSCKLLLNIFKFLDWPCIMHPRSSKTVVWVRVDPGGVPTGGDGFADLGMRIAVVWIVELLELQASCLWGANRSNRHPFIKFYHHLIRHLSTSQRSKTFPKRSQNDPHKIQVSKPQKTSRFGTLNHCIMRVISCDWFQIALAFGTWLQEGALVSLLHFGLCFHDRCGATRCNRHCLIMGSHWVV